MTFAVAIVVGITGVIAIACGLACWVLYWIGLGVFEKSLNKASEPGKDRAASAVWEISNLFLGRERAQELIATGNAEARTRGFLSSRMRAGLFVAAAGFAILIASFFTGSWLPMVWTSA